MKFFDLKGKSHSKDIARYKRPPGGRPNSSKGQKELGDKLENLFPNITIYEELPCVGTLMRLDFYMHALRMAFEFDGQQHTKYNAFMHGSKRAFIEAEKRDFYKEEWCSINFIRLVRVNKDSLEDLEKLINESRHAK
jgi:hypothetical protein